MTKLYTCDICGKRAKTLGKTWYYGRVYAHVGGESYRQTIYSCSRDCRQASWAALNQEYRGK